jgi:hypothetical protein
MNAIDKKMREFATRVSKELNLKMGTFGERQDRYCLTEWNDIDGFSWIDINIAPYDKEQENINMSREVFGGGDWHSLEDCDEETQAMVKDARENNLPLVWVELAIRDMRHKVHCCRYMIRPLAVLSEAWVFDGVKEWLDEQRANRPEKEAKTINMINRMGYDSVECDPDGDCIVVGIKGKYGLITLQGEPVCELKYDSIAAVKKGELMSVKINGKYGYINSKGEEIVSPKYDCAYCFEEGLAKVQIADKWGYINCCGEEIIPVKYDKICMFLNGYAPVCVNGKWGVITIDGKEVISPKYDDMGHLACNNVIFLNSYFEEDCINVQIAGKWGLVNSNGEEIIPLEYDDVKSVSDGRVAVCLNGKWGFIALDNKVVIPFEYDEVGEFGYGLANIKKGDKWGYINEQNELVIACKYDCCETFRNGKATVWLDGECSTIDTEGNTVECDDEEGLPF